VPSAAAKLWIEQQLPEEFNDALENAGLRDLRLEFWVAGTSLETTVANDIDSGTANAPQRDLATTQPPMATPEFSNRMVLHQTLWDAMGDDWLDEAVDILDSIDILGGGQQVTLRLNVPLDDQQTESLRRATKKIGWVIRIEENESPAQAC